MAYSTTELAKPNIDQFWAAKMIMPNTTARFFSGRGKVTVLGEDYYGSGIPGEDGVFGTLEPIEGKVGAEAPRLKLTLSGLQNSLLADARSYITQGSTVIVYDCLLNRATYGTVGDPELVFYGFIDIPSFDVGDTLTVALDCASALEYLFAASEGWRWTDAAQQEIYPGDRGFQYMTDITRRLPWGIENEARPVYTGDLTLPGSSIYTSLTGKP